MNSTKTLNPLINALCELNNSSPDSLNHAHTVWTSTLERQRVLIDNQVSLSDTEDEIQKAFFKVLNLSANLLWNYRGGQLGRYPIPQDPIWVKDLIPVLNYLINQGSFLSYTDSTSLYKNVESAFVFLADLSVLQEYKSFLLNNQKFHEALKSYGDVWVKTGRTDLLEFAVEMGYKWPEKSLFLVTDGATLEWFFNHKYPTNIKDNQGRELRDIWHSKINGHTQKEIGALNKVLLSFEPLDEEKAKKEFFKSMWSMSRSALNRDAKILKIDLKDEKYTQDVWSSFFELKNMRNLGIASIELAHHLCPLPKQRNNNGILFSTLSFFNSNYLDSKAIDLIEIIKDFKKEWEDLPPQVQLDEWVKLACNNMNCTVNSDQIKTMNHLISKVENTEENQVKILKIAHFIANGSYYVSNLFDIQKQRTFQKDEYQVSPLRSKLIDILLTISDEKLIKEKENINFIIFEYFKSIHKGYSQQVPPEELLKDLLLPGVQGISLVQRLSNLNALCRLKNYHELEKKWEKDFPEFLSILERSFLNQGVPETNNQSGSISMKKRI